MNVSATRACDTGLDYAAIPHTPFLISQTFAAWSGKLPPVTTLRAEFVQDSIRTSAEYRSVLAISNQLLDHLNLPVARARLTEANLPGHSSALVQATFEAFSGGLGFVSEAKGLFAEYATSALRPDYYLNMGATGILLEVERGKTTTNNMDLLDLWKCHICNHADYLFLLVPQALFHNEAMTPKKEYNSVVNRLGSFFVPGNETNVRGLHVFGY